MNSKKVLYYLKDKKEKIIRKKLVFQDDSIFEISVNDFKLSWSENERPNQVVYKIGKNNCIQIKPNLSFSYIVEDNIKTFKIEENISLKKMFEMVQALTQIKNVIFTHDEDYIIYNGEDTSYINLEAEIFKEGNTQKLLQDILFGEEFFIIPFFDVVRLINNKQQFVFFRNIAILGLVGTLFFSLTILYFNKDTNEITTGKRVEKSVTQKTLNNAKYTNLISLFKENLFINKLLKPKNQYDLENIFKYISNIKIKNGSYFITEYNRLSSNPTKTTTIGLSKKEKTLILNDTDLASYFSLGFDKKDKNLMSKLEKLNIKIFLKNSNNLRENIDRYLMEEFHFDKNLSLNNLKISNNDLFKLLLFVKTHNLLISKADINFVDKAGFKIIQINIKK